MRNHRLFLCTVALAGCTGILGEAGGDGDGAGAQYPLTDLPLARLSHDEYVQTLTDLVKEVVPGAADAVLAQVLPKTADLPADRLVAAPDQKHGGFARLDQSEQQEY